MKALVSASFSVTSCDGSLRRQSPALCCASSPVAAHLPCKRTFHLSAVAGIAPRSITGSATLSTAGTATSSAVSAGAAAWPAVSAGAATCPAAGAATCSAVSAGAAAWSAAVPSRTAALFRPGFRSSRQLPGSFPAASRQLQGGFSRWARLSPLDTRASSQHKWNSDGSKRLHVSASSSDDFKIVPVQRGEGREGEFDVLYWEADQKPSRGVVLFLHGFDQYPTDYEALLKAVTAQRIAVVAPVQTVGTSQQDVQNAAVSDANQVLGMLLSGAAPFDKLDLGDRSVLGLMGHSMGGGLTFAVMHHAIKSLNTPISHLAVFSPVPGVPSYTPACFINSLTPSQLSNALILTGSLDLIALKSTVTSAIIEPLKLKLPAPSLRTYNFDFGNHFGYQGNISARFNDNGPVIILPPVLLRSLSGTPLPGSFRDASDAVAVRATLQTLPNRFPALIFDLVATLALLSIGIFTYARSIACGGSAWEDWGVPVGILGVTVAAAFAFIEGWKGKKEPVPPAVSGLLVFGALVLLSAFFFGRGQACGDSWIYNVLGGGVAGVIVVAGLEAFVYSPYVQKPGTEEQLKKFFAETPSGGR